MNFGSQEKDKELAEYMESLENDDSLSYIGRLKKAIEWKKKNRNLIGLNMSVYDYSNKTTNETIAHDIFVMMLASAKGHTKDITNEPI